MLSLVRGQKVDKHTLKSSSSAWSHDLFLLFIMFIGEKPAPHRYDIEKGKSASIAFFLMMGHSCLRDNKNESISADECLSFSLPLFLFFCNLSSSATANSADLKPINTNGSLTQSKENIPSDGKYFLVFFFSSDKICRIKLARFLSSLLIFVRSNTSTLTSLLILAPHSVSFSLRC